MEPTREDLDTRIKKVKAQLRKVASDIRKANKATEAATGEERILLCLRKETALQENETALQEKKPRCIRRRVLLLIGMVAGRHVIEYIKVLCVVCDPCVVEVGNPLFFPVLFLTTFSFVSSFPDTHNVCVSSRRERSW